ncbi:MAG: O-antigen ligase family protein [Patescibacteria group bacterium]
MILLALSFGVVAFGLAWRRPAWGGLAVVALLPAYQLRFAVGGLPTTVLEVVLLGACCGAFLHWFQARSAWPALGNALPWVAGVWVVIGLFGMWVAADQRAALGLWRAYFLEPVLLIPLWLAVARDAHARKMLIHVVSGQLMVFALVASGQWLGWFHSLAPWNAEHPMRVTSLFPYPNAAALYAAPLAALVAGGFLAFRGRITRWERGLWIIGTFSGIVVCVLAVSRGALLGLGVAVLVAGAWSRRRVLWWGLCAAAVVALLLVPTIRNQVTGLVSTRDTSADVRTVLWQGTWHMLEARPLQGAGLGAFPGVYNHYRLPEHVELLQYPHNLLLNAWSELGLPGLVFTVAALFWLSVRLFRGFRGREPWAASITLAWIVLVAHGLVDVPYFKNDLAVLAVLLLMLVFAQPQTENKIPPA